MRRKLTAEQKLRKLIREEILKEAKIIKDKNNIIWTEIGSFNGTFIHGSWYESENGAEGFLRLTNKSMTIDINGDDLDELSQFIRKYGF